MKRRIRLAWAFMLVVVGLPVWTASSAPASSSPAVTSDGTNQVPITEELITQFAADFEAEMALYNIPGGAFAIIQGGEIVYMQGYGVRNIETNEPFTPQTQFHIGSTSKSFLSFMVAQVVDAGYLDWETRVIDIVPTFKTSDPWLTNQITVRDLLSMGTGLLSEDLLYDTVEELFSAVATQEIIGPFREYFSYNNEVYTTAAYVALMAAGLEPTVENFRAWMETHVFEPLNMPTAVLTDDYEDLTDNYSLSYQFALPPQLANPDTTLQPELAEREKLGVLGPAGSLWMSVEDMAQFLITQMSGGLTADGERVVSAEALAETWQPNVPVAGNPPREILGLLLSYQNAYYDMGWMTTTYRDITIRHHGGGIEGNRSNIAIFPELNVGFVQYSNGSGSAADGALMLHLAELLYGLEPEGLQATHRIFNEVIIGPVLGIYEDDWRVELNDDAALQLIHGDLESYPLYLEAIEANGTLVFGAPSLQMTLELRTHNDKPMLIFSNGTSIVKVSACTSDGC